MKATEDVKPKKKMSYHDELHAEIKDYMKRGIRARWSMPQGYKNRAQRRLEMAQAIRNRRQRMRHDTHLELAGEIESSVMKLSEITLEKSSTEKTKPSTIAKNLIRKLGPLGAEKYMNSLKSQLSA